MVVVVVDVSLYIMGVLCQLQYPVGWKAFKPKYLFNYQLCLHAFQCGDLRNKASKTQKCLTPLLPVVCPQYTRNAAEVGNCAEPVCAKFDLDWCDGQSGCRELIRPGHYCYQQPDIAWIYWMLFKATWNTGTSKITNCCWCWKGWFPDVLIF